MPRSANVRGLPSIEVHERRAYAWSAIYGDGTYWPGRSHWAGEPLRAFRPGQSDTWHTLGPLRSLRTRSPVECKCKSGDCQDQRDECCRRDQRQRRSLHS